MRVRPHPTLLAGVLTLTSGMAAAHEGHGLPGLSHWHASDTLGFVVAAGLVGLLAWWSRRK